MDCDKSCYVSVMIKFTDVFLSFLSHVALVPFSQVMQQQTLGELEIWMVIWWPVISEMFIPKIIEILLSFSKFLLRMVFGVFLFILTLISCVLIPQGCAEAYIGWGRNWNNHLMTSYV